MNQLEDDLGIYQNRWWGVYLDALLEQQQAELAVTLCASQRANALARLCDSGWSMAQIAEAAHLSRERVWQLVSRDRRR
jgi:DNA-binding phage protein